MIHIVFSKVAYNNDTQTSVFNKLTPRPQKMERVAGSIIFDENIKVSVEGNEESHDRFPKLFKNLDVDYIIEPTWTMDQFTEKIRYWLNLRLEELHSDYKFTEKQFKVQSQEWNLDTVSVIPVDFQRQAYYLNINNKGIEIVAWTMRGAYYGIVTLTQLIYFEKKAHVHTTAIPGVTIWDWPQYPVRGLVDDISRGQRPTIENFKSFIRFLSRTKQNVLVLYIEDIFQFKHHPRIGAGRGALSPADIKVLEAYAKEWFVNILPGVEMLGHMDNMLTDPEYIQYAEFPGAQCLDISNPKTKDFVKELLADVVPVFESPIFAPICDESFDFGLRRSKDIIESKGYGNALADWYLFLIEEIQKLGKPVVLFAHDIIHKYPEALKAIEKANAMIYFWQYSNAKKYPIISKLTKAGLSTFGGPAVFDWSRHYPYFDYAEINMLEMGKDGMERGLIGLVTTKWGDFFNENFRDNIFYGLAVNGQAAWTPLESKVDQIREGFVWQYWATEDLRILECLDTLSKQNKVLPSFPNGMFNRFWMDPFIRKIKKSEYADGIRFVKEGEYILEIINKLKTQKIMQTNQENLDYMAYSARMARHYGAKILISEASFWKNPALAKSIQDILKYSGDPILGGFEWLKSDIDTMLPEYQRLWRNLAVEEGLEYPTERFHILSWHYEQAIKDLNAKIEPHAHQLQSEWIWRAGKRTKVDWGNMIWHYFMKTFTVSKPVKKATIQGIAANNLIISCNGQRIGEVFSRFSLSQFPMAKAVQWFDLTSHIKNGTNILCVDGINWAMGIGAINVIAHIEYEDSTTEDIITDGSWKYTETKPENWPFTPEANLDTIVWTPVRSYGSPPSAWQGPISTPIWEKGWKSGISFAFGNRNFSESAIQVVLGKKAYSMLFWLLPTGMKVLHLDNTGYRGEK